MMKTFFSTLAVLALCTTAFGQKKQREPFIDTLPPKKWGVEINVLWPIYPGNIYKANVTYEAWRVKTHFAGDVVLGVHIRPFEFRPDEGYFANYALTFGYRQFLWQGLHLEFYNAFGPGINKKNAITGKNYLSWDYEIGGFAGYRYEFLPKRLRKKVSPYISTQHGVLFVAAQSNRHPIIDYTGERPIYAGTLNIGLKF